MFYGHGRYQTSSKLALTDDEEAFRLANDLGFKIEHDWFNTSVGADKSRGGKARVFTTYSLEQTGSFDFRPQWFKVSFIRDPHAATRKAIVEATWTATDDIQYSVVNSCGFSCKPVG